MSRPTRGGRARAGALCVFWVALSTSAAASERAPISDAARTNAARAAFASAIFLVGGLGVAVRRLRKQAEEETADRLLASEIERLRDDDDSDSDSDT